MQNYSHSDNQRNNARYFLKNDIFLDIKGDLIHEKFKLRDLSNGGLGFYATKAEKRLVGKKVLVDLISDNNKLILRSFPSKIVSSHGTIKSIEYENEVSERYGIAFVNLSRLKKMMLASVMNKYIMPDSEQNSS